MLPISAAVAVLVLSFVNSIDALSLTYRFRSYEPKNCFLINVPDSSQKISIYFNVHETKASENGHAVDYVVYGPNSQQLQTQKGSTHADFMVVPTMSGEHSLCFSHSGSTSEKTLDVDVTLTKPVDASGKPSLNALEASSPTAELERINQRVTEDLRALHHSLLYIKDREKGNQYTVLSIKGLIKWFSILLCLTVILLGFAHVYVLKTFFSSNARAKV